MIAKRTFQLIQCSPNDGIDLTNCNFHGRGPAQAALKAFNKYCHLAQLDSGTRKITIHETAGKTFRYIGSRTKLPEPKVITRNGNEFQVCYHNSVHKII
jgi:hypothetical protein